MEPRKSEKKTKSKWIFWNPNEADGARVKPRSSERSMWDLDEAKEIPMTQARSGWSRRNSRLKWNPTWHEQILKIPEWTQTRWDTRGPNKTAETRLDTNETQRDGRDPQKTDKNRRKPKETGRDRSKPTKPTWNPRRQERSEESWIDPNKTRRKSTKPELTTRQDRPEGNPTRSD